MKLKFLALAGVVFLTGSILSNPANAAMGGKKFKIAPCTTQGNSKAQSAILKSKMKQIYCATSPEVDPKFGIFIAYDPTTSQFTSYFNWNEAQQAALLLSNPTSGYINGAKLTGIRNQAEQDLVHQINLSFSTSYWTGGFDPQSDGTWKWQDTGQTFSTGFTTNGTYLNVPGIYTNWFPGEPNGFPGEETCVEGYAFAGWNNIPCGYGHPMFIYRFN